jgi:hypothetical protein
LALKRYWNRKTEYLMVWEQRYVFFGLFFVLMIVDEKNESIA